MQTPLPRQPFTLVEKFTRLSTGCVTLVTRGEDLLHATHVHRVLQALLNLSTPDYHHHGLLRAPSGERFAKRDKAETLQALRAAGRTLEQVRRMALA